MIQNSLVADGVEINVEEGHWRLYNLQGAHSLSPFFDTVRGTGLLNYVPQFAETRGLPGTVLSSDYVESVVAGFDEKRQRWLLGLYVQLKQDEKPRFIPLAQWPEGNEAQNGASAHQAGRVLAEYLACPLKLIGAKKPLTVRSGGTGRLGAAGVTGPLVAHQRTDLDTQRVRFKAQQIQLPLEGNGLWLGATRSGATLRISREADRSRDGNESPTFTQVIVDRDAQTVRLVAPTGLLGAFMGGSPGRNIKFQDVRNIELRYTITHDSTTEKADDGAALDVSETNHIYTIYLTIGNESILLAQLRHTKSHKLASRRMKTGALDPASYNAEREMHYLKQQQVDAEHHERISTFAEATAVVLAAAIGCSLVRTEIGEA